MTLFDEAIDLIGAELHPVLQRQLKRLDSKKVGSVDVRNLVVLLRAVSETYSNADKDRYLMENSLAISSREMREALLKSNGTLAILEKTLNATNDGILVADGRNGKMIVANRVFSKMWNISTDIIERKDDNASLTAAITQVKDPEAFIQKVRELYLDSQQESFDSVEFKDGRIFERFSAPILITENYHARVWSFRDVTEARRNAVKLARSERMAAIGNVTAGVAHEINNPIGYALANIELLIEKFTHDSGTLKMLKRVEDGLLRMKEFTSSMKSLSKDSSELVEDVDLHEILNDALSITIGSKRSHVLVVKNYNSTSIVRGSKSKFAQVFINLISNAIDAMKSPEENSNVLTINTRDLPSHRVEVVIKDTGCGIPQDSLSSIFDAFYTTKGKDGSGLGLSIVENIVADFGGEITVESTSGLGTSMMLTFRGREKTAEAPAPASTTPEQIDSSRKNGPAAKPRVLIIDDEVILAESMALAIESQVDVSITYTPKEAMNFILNNPSTIDIILCDLMMPGMSGFEFYHQATEKFPNLIGRVIFISGGKLGSHRDFVIPDNCLLIAKPFSIQKLRTAIQEFLARPGKAA